MNKNTESITYREALDLGVDGIDSALADAGRYDLSTVEDLIRARRDLIGYAETRFACAFVHVTTTRRVIVSGGRALRLSTHVYCGLDGRTATITEDARGVRLLTAQHGEKVGRIRAFGYTASADEAAVLFCLGV